ncbi:T9SS type A sorting domain-containing protein [candidate division WOR-3 bacterium]|nr:T9SS type A sorting domain-containing protein [candidate division WOR-3 bacterium]
MVLLVLLLLSGWTTEVVTTTARELIGPPLAIDSYGMPYVLVHSDQPGTGYLILFYKSDGNWIADTLECSAMPDCRDIAIDRSGNVWCVYYLYSPSGSCRYLIVASKESHAWQKDTVEISSGYDFFSNSITTDTLGRPHITYDFAQYGYYGYLRDSIWCKEIIDSNATYNYLYCAIDADHQNRLHVGYYQFGQYSGPIWHAEKKDNLWYCEVVESPGSVNMWWPTSIRAGQGRVGIAYTNPDPNSYRLKLAHNNGTAWEIDTLTSGFGCIWNQKALDIDALGRYWLSYTSGTVPIVAFREVNDWHICSLPPLVPPLTRGRSGAIRVDSENKIHLTRLVANDDYSYREIHYIYGTPEAIEENKVQNLKTESVKLKISPNIVYTNAQIRYTIPETQRITLDIYDITGRRINAIIDGTVKQGSYTYNLSSSALGQGVYFLVLATERKIERQKLMIVR